MLFNSIPFHQVLLVFYIFVLFICTALLDVAGVLLFFSFLGPEYTRVYLKNNLDSADPATIAAVTASLKTTGGICLGFLVLAALALWAAAVIAGPRYILRRTCQVLNVVSAVYGIIMITVAINQRVGAPWAASLVGAFGAVVVFLGIFGFFALGEQRRELLIVFLVGMSVVAFTIFILAVLVFSMPQKTASFLDGSSAGVGCQPTPGIDCAGLVVNWWEARPALIGGIVASFLILLGTNMVSCGYFLWLAEKGELKPLKVSIRAVINCMHASMHML